MNMIEKVARALMAKADSRNLDWTLFRDEAITAIEAMKEPTEEMCKMISPTADLTREDVLCIYRAMIEAALKQ